MIPRSFGTHDGSFHADEVTACSLLLLCEQIERDKIIRSRNPALLAQCDYVCDVGGVYDASTRRFDHHQVEYQGPMSSAGMILLYLKDQGVLHSHLYDWFNKVLILGVDAHDNGRATLDVGVTNFSQVVSNFLPIEYDSPPEVMQDAFFQALDFTLEHLIRLKKRFCYTQTCEGIVKMEMARSQDVLIFDRPLPWMENFFDLGGELHSAQFVIMPSGNQWKLRGIPPTLRERMKLRKPLPEKWAGLQGIELREVCGISGAIFCHKGRFMSIWETKSDALAALQIAMRDK